MTGRPGDRAPKPLFVSVEDGERSISSAETRPRMLYSTTLSWLKPTCMVAEFARDFHAKLTIQSCVGFVVGVADAEGQSKAACRWPRLAQRSQAGFADSLYMFGGAVVVPGVEHSESLVAPSATVARASTLARFSEPALRDHLTRYTSPHSVCVAR